MGEARRWRACRGSRGGAGSLREGEPWTCSRLAWWCREFERRRAEVAKRAHVVIAASPPLRRAFPEVAAGSEPAARDARAPSFTSVDWLHQERVPSSPPVLPSQARCSRRVPQPARRPPRRVAAGRLALCPALPGHAPTCMRCSIPCPADLHTSLASGTTPRWNEPGARHRPR
jgi:hypothetical protein